MSIHGDGESDSDDDNDGIPDEQEDEDSDGIPDHSGDGIPDYGFPDSEGSGRAQLKNTRQQVEADLQSEDFTSKS